MSYLLITYLKLSLFLVDLSTKSVGPKQETGFTHAYNDEPITFKPNDVHDGKLPVCNMLITSVSFLINDFKILCKFFIPVESETNA